MTFEKMIAALSPSIYSTKRKNKNVPASVKKFSDFSKVFLRIKKAVLHFSEDRRKLLLIQFSKPMNFLKSLFIILFRLLTALWVL